MEMFSSALQLFLLIAVQAGISYSKNVNESIKAATKEICMDELGCFGIDKDFFDIRYRPINVLPDSRDRIQTRFLLYSRERPTEKHILRANHQNTLDSSSFDSKRETKVIIHGLLDNEFLGRWMERMKTALLVQGDYNVIIVDWSKGNGFPYTKATANTRVVAAELALLLTFLKNKAGLKEKDVHLIGHSLGAHVAGYTGKRFKNIGRITGLDPAEPYFQYMPPTVRLDRTDADFVDVIHTDAAPIIQLGLGMRQSVGHVDFFPNNGDEHPGCTGQMGKTFAIEGLIEGVRTLVACEHQRAIDFFHASIGLKACEMLAYQCPNYNMYLQGRCSSCGLKGEKCAVMGFKADEWKKFKRNDRSIDMYLKTSGEAPFCTYGYQVAIDLAKPKGASDVKGTLHITLYGKDGLSYSQQLTSEPTDLYAGSQYSYLVTPSENLGKIEKVVFQWKQQADFRNLFRVARLYLKSIRVTPISITDKTARNAATSYLCGTQSDAVNVNEKMILHHDDQCKNGRKSESY